MQNHPRPRNLGSPQQATLQEACIVKDGACGLNKKENSHTVSAKIILPVKSPCKTKEPYIGPQVR